MLGKLNILFTKSFDVCGVEMADKDIFKANMARVKDIQKLANDLRASIIESEGKLSALKPRDPIVVQNLKEIIADKNKDLDALNREYFDLVDEDLTFEANSGFDPNADALTKLATILQNNPRDSMLCSKLADLFSFQQVQTIPQFSGKLKEKSILDWFKMAEKTAVTAGWDDSQKLRFFSSRLTKPASDFHETLVKEQKALVYSQWKKYLMEGFMDEIEKDQARSDLESLRQKPDQRIRDFAREIDDLYSKAYGVTISEATDDVAVQLRDREKKKIFFTGMKEAVYKRLVLFVPKSKTFKEIVEASQEIEEQVTWEKLTPNREASASIVNALAAFNNLTVNDDHSIPQDQKSEINVVDSGKSRKEGPAETQRRDRSTDRPTDRSLSRGRDNSRSSSYSRDQRGRNFPQKYKGNVPQGRVNYDKPRKVRFDVECFKCHKKGHFARECRSSRPNNPRQ